MWNTQVRNGIYNQALRRFECLKNVSKKVEQANIHHVPEWLLLLPIWLSDWLCATWGRSWHDWIGESCPDGATLGAFSMFFISISSWWIHRSGGRRSFWLPFLLLALWLALFLHRGWGTQRWGRSWPGGRLMLVTWYLYHVTRQPSASQWSVKTLYLELKHDELE